MILNIILLDVYHPLCFYLYVNIQFSGRILAVFLVDDLIASIHVVANDLVGTYDVPLWTYTMSVSGSLICIALNMIECYRYLYNPHGIIKGQHIFIINEAIDGG